MKQYLFAMIFLLPSTTLAQHPIAFQTRWLTVDSNEGCTIADFDADGKLDVSAGRNWYRNGDWLPRPIRLIEDKNGYVRSNGEWALDINRDGNPDILSIDYFSGELYWYQNPGPDGLQRGLVWKKNLLGDTRLTTNEASYLIDLDKDGKLEWVTDQWNANNPLIAWTLELDNQPTTDAKQGDKKTNLNPAISEHLIGAKTGHGIGFGDINLDGRDDILVGTGWYECPETDVLEQRWKYHPAWNIQGSCPMLVHDVDGDGKNDVLVSNAHNFGIMMWRNEGVDENGEVLFQVSMIDKSFSQAHCLHLADLDGDGTQELITGKRVRAHNGNDPGGKEPPIMKYYVWDKESKTYQAQVINEGQVGIGLQIRTADIDGDGDVDIVVAGKDGTQILFSQKTKQTK